VLGFSLLFLTNFHIPQWQACTSKLTRNCLAIDWERVNLFTIDREVLIKTALAICMCVVALLSFRRWGLT
jgi:hypothetical protein